MYSPQGYSETAMLSLGTLPRFRDYTGALFADQYSAVHATALMAPYT